MYLLLETLILSTLNHLVSHLYGLSHSWISNGLNLKLFNSLPTSCRLLITFAYSNLCKSLDPDQARQNVGPDLDPNCLTL